MSGGAVTGTAVVFAPIAEHVFRSQCLNGNNLMVLTDRIGGLRVQVAGGATSAMAGDVE